MDFVLITPETLRAHWPVVRSSLDAIHAKAAEDWIAEDVYHALATRASLGWVAYEAGAYAGMIVMSLTTSEFSKERQLHVWLAHNAGSADVVTGAMELIQETAYRMGVKRITMGSPRPGWGKRFKPVSITYEIPMEPRS